MYQVFLNNHEVSRLAVFKSRSKALSFASECLLPVFVVTPKGNLIKKFKQYYIDYEN